MTEEEVRQYLGRPVRLTLDDGCVVTGTLYAHEGGEDGHSHYAAVSESARAGSPNIAETIHGAERIVSIDDVLEDEESLEEDSRPFTDELGLLASRLVIGLGMAAHGAQKAFGWFGGGGPDGAAGFMESLGFKPGSTYGPMASYNELVGGSLIALGFAGPVGPAMLMSQMLVAAATVHFKNGFFAANGGMELPAVYSAGALALASSGYGKLSIDSALGIDDTLGHPVVKTLVLAGGIAAGSLILSGRETAPEAETSSSDEGAQTSS